MVYGPPALPDLLVTGKARGAVTQPVSVQLDHPPPVTGVRREAFAGAQGVQHHRITEIVRSRMIGMSLSSDLTRLERFWMGSEPPMMTNAGHSRVTPDNWDRDPYLK